LEQNLVLLPLPALLLPELLRLQEPLPVSVSVYSLEQRDLLYILFH
jgi:hypothetical protein